MNTSQFLRSVLVMCLLTIAARVAWAQNYAGELNTYHLQQDTPGSQRATFAEKIVRNPETGNFTDERNIGEVFERYSEVTLTTGYAGRAAFISDSTRLANSASGSFLPSAIPVPGQQFFGAGSQSTILGNGSAVALQGTKVINEQNVVSGSARLNVSDLSANGFGAVLQEAYGSLDNWMAGLAESAFADTDNHSLPDVLDFAGPSARVTVFGQGTNGSGQGRLTYHPLNTHGAGPGWDWLMSGEAGQPEIQSGIANAAVTRANTSTFTRFPDLISTIRFTTGEMVYDESIKKERYFEQGHLQFGTLFRSLGLQSADQTLMRTANGYGLSLSGHYRFFTWQGLEIRDGVFFSSTYGRGIAHYINDLHTGTTELKTGGNDAILNASQTTLTPLPVLAWYTGYTHNWTNSLKSTVTYSHVNLDSTLAQGANNFTYRMSDYAAINLVYHSQFNVTTGSTTSTHFYYTGLEYLYGQKEVLGGSHGHDDRLLFVVAFSK